jgi:hypothetical protein
VKKITYNKQIIRLEKLQLCYQSLKIFPENFLWNSYTGFSEMTGLPEMEI